MNLDEMLLYADIEQINKIADNYQCQCDRHSKTEMIQSIIYKIYKRDMLFNYIEKLNPVEFSFVQLIFFDSRIRFTIEDLLAKAKQAIAINNSDIKPKQLVIMALKKGWVFQGVGKKNLLVYLVPTDFKSRLLEALKQHLEIKLSIVEEIDFYRDEQTLLVADLYTFLQYLTKNDVLLTGTGSIYRRNQQEILQLFQVPEQPINKQTFRFGYGRRYNEYPDRFSLIYDFAFFHNYIEENENGLLNLTNNGYSWLIEGNRLKEDLKVYKFWMRLYKNSIPFLPLIVKMIDLIAYKRWIEITSVLNISNNWLNDHFYENKEEVFMERVIKMLLHLGMIQIGSSIENKYLRVTEEGHQFINDFESFNAKDIVL